MKASEFEKMARERLATVGIAFVLAAMVLGPIVSAAPAVDCAADVNPSGDNTIHSLPPAYEPKAPGAWNILIAMADDTSEPTRSYLLSQPTVASVNVYDVRSGTPTVGELLSYDIVWVWTDYNCQDPILLGNNLADYIDAGGRVVMSDFCWWSDVGTYSLSGRIMSDGYSPLTSLNGQGHYSWANLGAYDASHPLMQGVTAVSAYYRDWVSLTPGATLVASWDDGEEFIAVKDNVIAVNLYQRSSWGGDYPTIVANIASYSWLGLENWVSDEWARALPISVTNPNAFDLTDYQVKVTVPYHRGMRLDYADLRFAESDGTEFIPHWMEKSSRVSATFWVRLPFIPASSDITIAAYFDNMYAPSASNGDATFQFFDDFTGTAVNTAKWSGSTGNFAVSNGYLRGTSTTYSLRSTAWLTDPIAIETRTRAVSLATNGQVTLGFWESTGNSIGILEHAPLPGQYWYHNSGGGAWVGPWSFNFEAWHNSRIGITSANTGSLFVINDLGETTQQNFNVDVTDERITLGQRYDSILPGQAYDQFWDWIFARNYVANEPTALASGLPILISGGSVQNWADWAWTQAVDIIVANPNPAVLANHQVKIVLPFIAGMQADYDDIRFTEGYGTGFLPYWLQESTGASATYWVKVTEIPASGDLRIRAYFNNPVAHYAGNGEEVFTFFDGFDDTQGLNTNKWDTMNSGIGSTTFANGRVTIASGGDWWGNADDARYIVTKRGLKMPTNFVTECFVNQVGADAYNRFFGLRSGSATNEKQFVFLRDNDGTHITNVYRDAVNGAANWYGENSGTVNTGNNRIAKFVRIGDQVLSSYGGASANVRTIGNWNLAYIALTDTHNAGSPSIFDWVFVRQWATTDPTFTVAAGSILQPIQESGFVPGEGSGEVQPVIVPGPSSHMPEAGIESSALFDNLAWVMVLVACGGVTVILIGRRMSRRD